MAKCIKKNKTNNKAKVGAFAFALFMSALTGCGSISMPKLRSKADAGTFSYSDNENNFQDFVSKVNDFALPWIENVNANFQSKENVAYSPASLFYATAMLSKVTANEDQTNLLEILGVNENEINQYFGPLYRACNREYGNKKITGKEKIDNSVWLDEKFQFKEETLDDLANVFYADVFSCDFYTNNEKSNQAIGDYVKKCTDGLLKPEYKFDIDTAFVLLNTLYFEDVWNNEGIDLQKDEERNFKNYDNSQTKLQFYKTYYESGKIIETEKYKSAYARTLNGFMIDFIVPKDGVDVEELFTEDVLRDYNSKERVYSEMVCEENTYYYTNLSTPEYEASFDDDILTNFYDAYKINGIDDFTNFVSESNGIDDFRLESIIHTTKVEFKKDKVRGAAATAVGGDCADVPPQREVYETLIVDRPFIYSIRDPQNINLFKGIVYKL